MRTVIECKCGLCGSLFDKIITEYNRTVKVNRHHYCCKVCFMLAQKNKKLKAHPNNKIECICNNCGKTIFKFNTFIKKAESRWNNHYCNKECYYEAKRNKTTKKINKIVVNYVDKDHLLKNGYKDEHWIIGSECRYSITPYGEVYSYRGKCGAKRKLAQRTIYSGYKSVKLCVNSKSIAFFVHRLVALTFIPNPNLLKEINHINKIKSDNRVENLEWCTRSYNVRHARAIINTNIAFNIRQLSKNGMSVKDISNQLNISQGITRNVLLNKSWVTI